MGLGAASMIENCRMTNTRNMQQYMNLFKDSSDTANALINMSPLFEKNTTKSSAPTVPKNDLCKSSPLTKSHLLCTNCDANVLTQQEQIEETMFLGLRCIKGIDTHAFYQIFGRSVYDIYQPIIKKYAAQGLLVDNPSSGRIYLTEAGFNVSNRILADFLLDE